MTLQYKTFLKTIFLCEWKGNKNNSNTQTHRNKQTKQEKHTKKETVDNKERIHQAKQSYVIKVNAFNLYEQNNIYLC